MSRYQRRTVHRAESRLTAMQHGKHRKLEKQSFLLDAPNPIGDGPEKGTADISADRDRVQPIAESTFST